MPGHVSGVLFTDPESFLRESHMKSWLRPT